MKMVIRKIYGEIIQEIIEKQMELKMSSKNDDVFALGRWRGLEDAAEIISNKILNLQSSTPKVKIE